MTRNRDDANARSDWLALHDEGCRPVSVTVASQKQGTGMVDEAVIAS